MVIGQQKNQTDARDHHGRDIDQPASAHLSAMHRALEQIDKRKQGASAPTRRHRPNETRLKVLEAARQLFRKGGYAHTSTAEIAEAAGVAEGSIFYHFGSKSKLLDSLGAVYAHEKVAAMARGETDLSKLEPGIMIERAFAYCEAHGMGEAQVGLDQDNPELQPFIEVNREIVVGFISKVMAASMPPESPAYADIEIAASLAYAAVTDALCHVFARPDPLDRDAVLRETIRFVRAACGYDAGTKAIQHEKPDG